MGVDLGRRDIGMAEQHLHRPQVRPALQQMGSEGVAQHVRADPLGRDAGVGGKLADQLIEAHPAQMLLAGREQPERVARHGRGMLGHGVARAIGDRHQPLPLALPTQDQERLVRLHCIARQGDELGGAKTRAVEQFDESGEAKCAGAPLAFPALDLREQGVHGAMIEDLGQRPLAGRARQGGGGIIRAHPFVLQEGVETPQRRRLASDRGPLEGHPGFGEAVQRLRARARQSPTQQFGRAAQVALIGEQRVARRPGFGGHHFEEGGDGLAIVQCGHDRATASAAIIRASKSMPTARKARTIRNR